MATVSFTPNLARWAETSAMDVPGDSLAAVLEAVFAERPVLRGYLLTDQGTLRKHVNIYIDAESIGDRQRLTDRVAADSKVFVAQALSGG